LLQQLNIRIFPIIDQATQTGFMNTDVFRKLTVGDFE